MAQDVRGRLNLLSFVAFAWNTKPQPAAVRGRGLEAAWTQWIFMGICVVCDYWGSACKASKHHGIVDGKVNVFAWCETEKYWNERIGISTAMEK